MKRHPLPAARGRILLAAYLAITASAPAATEVTGSLINVDFNSGGNAGAGGLTDPVTFDGDLLQNEVTAASVAFVDDSPETNDVWNGFETPNQTNQPLVDSTGEPTPLTLTWTGFDGNYTNYLNGRDGTELLERTDGPNGDGHLLFGAGAARSGVVTLGGLDPAVVYDVVAIGGGSDPVTFSIGSESQAIGEWNSVSNPSTWRLFSGVIPNGAGEVTLTVSTNGTNNFGIGGVQITAVGTVSDTDGDGLPDTWEDANGLNKSSSADGSPVVSPVTDPDADGVPNITEFQRNTNPQNPDTDGDTLKDGIETNTGLWVSPTNTGTDPLKADTDGDRLTDDAENPDLAAGSDPNKRDTDGDGFTDKAEVDAGTNPKDPASSPRSVVRGRLINYDFNGDVGGAAPLTDPVLFDGNLARDPETSASVALEDAAPAVNDIWNGAEGSDTHASLADTPQPTVDSAGNPTDVTVTWSGFAFNYTNYTNGRDGGGFTSGPNGDGFFATTTAQPTVTIGGLDPALTYTLATIGAGDPVKFIVGGEERLVPQWNSTLNPSNWVVYPDVAPSEAGEIVITVSSINGQTNFGIGGFQIAFPEAMPARDFKIITFSRDAGTGEITLTWTSTVGKTYSILWSSQLASFGEEVAGHSDLPGVAGTLTRTFPPPVANAPQLFFKVKEE